MTVVAVMPQLVALCSFCADDTPKTCFIGVFGNRASAEMCMECWRDVYEQFSQLARQVGLQVVFDVDGEAHSLTAHETQEALEELGDGTRPAEESYSIGGMTCNVQRN